MKVTYTKELIPADFVRKMKFYLTSPQPCPYLPGRMERKVFANLAVDGAVGLNDSLTRSGFRRSQTIAYRPAYKTCGACRSVRIDVAAFKMSRRWRKVLARNAGRPVSKADLSAQALGRPLARFDRSIDVHLSSIRHKLGLLPGGRSCIQTVYRQGYQLIRE